MKNSDVECDIATINNEAIKPGFRFKNGTMDLTVLCFTKINDTNLALLICSNDGLFITVRNLGLWRGHYTWDWGHYFPDVHDAVADYNNRKKDL